MFARESALPTYDPKTGEGFWRHLVVRKTKHTNECMLIWSVNTAYSGFTKQEKQRIVDFTETLAKKYPVIHSVYILENTGRADIVTGNTLCIYGKESISEILLGKSFEIQPKSFFQTNSLGAERLYTRTLEMCPEKGEILLDLYAGTGTIGILLSDRFQKVYSVELVESSSYDGEKNAIRNNVKNIEFINKKTEDFLPEFLDIPESKKDITLVVDPPRDGIHPDACRDILKFLANTIVYVSCNPATLVRDLQILLGVSFHHPKEGNTQDPEDEALDSPPTGDKLTQDDGTKTNQPQYRITDITPVDMFPHTHHIETVVRLEKI